jgi:hypothetical protein
MRGKCYLPTLSFAVIALSPPAKERAIDWQDD